MILFNVHVIHFRTFYEFVYMPPVTVNLRVFMCAGFFAMTICFESQTGNEWRKNHALRGKTNKYFIKFSQVYLDCSHKLFHTAFVRIDKWKFAHPEFVYVYVILHECRQKTTAEIINSSSDDVHWMIQGRDQV